MDEYGYATPEEVSKMTPEETLVLRGIKQTFLLTSEELAEFKQRFVNIPTNKPDVEK